MDVNSIKTAAEQDVAGRVVGAVASFCIARNKTAVLEKFKEVGNVLEETLTEAELKQLRQEVEDAAWWRSQEITDLIEKIHSPEDVTQFSKAFG